MFVCFVSQGRRHSIAGSGAEANQPRLLAGLFKSHRSRDKPKPKKRSNSLSNGRVSVTIIITLACCVRLSYPGSLLAATMGVPWTTLWQP